MMRLKQIFSFVLIASLLKVSICFIPAQVIDTLVEKIDEASNKLDFGQVSDSFSHEEILRRGVIRSVARFFYDQPNGSKKINLNDMNRYFKSIEQLYKDYYGSLIAGVIGEIGLVTVLKTELQPQVASVDFNPDTKDLPYAHFDAERLAESNQRVITFTSNIYTAISKSDYSTARKLSGQILHTIQDFYSHSNWVEMAKTQINSAIGTNDFTKQAATKLTDKNECKESATNCKLVTIQCSDTLTKISDAMKKLNPSMSLSCPLKYYKCNGNIVTLDKMLSGYYTNSKLPDGTLVNNPGGMKKCNHGGILDSNSYVKDAVGGINKDAGIYLISPHADLHLKAANFAELHTEYFFNSIRKSIGDDKFAKFLKIYLF